MVKGITESFPAESLRLIVRYANLETISLLISRKLLDGNDLFLAATAEGKLSIVRVLYDFLKETDLWDFKDRTKRYKSKEVFRSALKTPSKDVWDFIIEKRKLYGLRTSLDDSFLQRLLEECVYQGGEIAMVKHLLDLGVDVNGIRPFEKDRRPDQPRPLLDACISGDEDVVRLLVDRGACTTSAIAVAAANGHTAVVRILLNIGADPLDGLMRAARGGYLDIVRMLLDAGVDPSESVDTEYVSIYISGGLGEELPSKVPLACAIANEYVEMATLLWERGARHDVYAAMECKRIAIEEGLESMLTLLTKWGIDELEETFEMLDWMSRVEPFSDRSEGKRLDSRLC